MRFNTTETSNPEGKYNQKIGQQWERQRIGLSKGSNDASHPISEGLERSGEFIGNNITMHGGRTHWEQDWLEVATCFCGVDDGLPVELDGFKLSRARHRVGRLKALGNAIVPQVAMEIMRSIKEVDDDETRGGHLRQIGNEQQDISATEQDNINSKGGTR